MVDNQFKFLYVICYCSCLPHSIKLSNQHLMPIAAEARAEQRGKRFPIIIRELLLDRLEPNRCGSREVECCHRHPKSAVYAEHLKVLFAQCYPQIRDLPSELWKGNGRMGLPQPCQQLARVCEWRKWCCRRDGIGRTVGREWRRRAKRCRRQPPCNVEDTVVIRPVDRPSPLGAPL